MTQPATEQRRRLRAARAYAGLTQTELGTKLGISHDRIQRFEAGKTNNPLESEGLLRKAADACDVPYEFFTADWSVFGFEAEADRLARTIEQFHQLVEQARKQGVRLPQPDPAATDRALREQAERERGDEAPEDEVQPGRG